MTTTSGTIGTTIETIRPLHVADHLFEFKAALEQQRQFRLEQLHELAQADAHALPAVDDVHDHVREILRSGAAAALVNIEHALERLCAGTFGICERCTTRISNERLEILPMSRYCMRCQHVLELGEVESMAS